MRINSLVLSLLLGMVCTHARADDPAPAAVTPPAKAPVAAPVTAPSATNATKPPAAKKPDAAKPAKPGAASDEEEPAPKSAPRRFVPTDKGKADEDIPFPVDI